MIFDKKMKIPYHSTNKNVYFLNMLKLSLLVQRSKYKFKSVFTYYLLFLEKTWQSRQVRELLSKFDKKMSTKNDFLFFPLFVYSTEVQKLYGPFHKICYLNVFCVTDFFFDALTMASFLWVFPKAKNNTISHVSHD